MKHIRQALGSPEESMRYFVTRRFKIIFLAHRITDMVPGDKYDAGDSPHLYKDHPHPMLEGALVMVPHPYA